MKEKNKYDLIRSTLVYVIFMIPFGIRDIIEINNQIIRYSYLLFLMFNYILSLCLYSIYDNKYKELKKVVNK